MFSFCTQHLDGPDARAQAISNNPLQQRRKSTLQITRERREFVYENYYV
jgi:hypothetical protein